MAIRSWEERENRRGERVRFEECKFINRDDFQEEFAGILFYVAYFFIF